MSDRTQRVIGPNPEKWMGPDGIQLRCDIPVDHPILGALAGGFSVTEYGSTGSTARRYVTSRKSRGSEGGFPSLGGRPRVPRAEQLQKQRERQRGYRERGKKANG